MGRLEGPQSVLASALGRGHPDLLKCPPLAIGDCVELDLLTRAQVREGVHAGTRSNAGESAGEALQAGEVWLLVCADIKRCLSPLWLASQLTTGAGAMS